MESREAVIKFYLSSINLKWETWMFYKSLKLAEFDAELNDSILEETRRQETHIELIASENYTSPLVMEAQGNALTNKYAEGDCSGLLCVF